MFCWSCGEELSQGNERCSACGVPAAAVLMGHARTRVAPRVAVSICPGCGYLGEGMPYFRRSSHAVLLVGTTVLTYGIGGLLYWLVKRDASVCPSCGLSWDRARRLDNVSPPDAGEVGIPPALVPLDSEQLPRGGLVRRILGVTLGILAVFLLGTGVVQASAETVVASISVGLVGGSSFAWGWRALQHRREGLLRSLQTKVLRVAAAHRGRLTATDVAAELDVTLPAAERVLFSLDDGFRVRSDVTDEGLLVFDFPEIRMRNLPGAREAPQSVQLPEPTES